MTKINGDELEFNCLASEWDKETSHLSNPTTIRQHPNYAKLIAYGEAAIPWLLKRIARGNMRLEYSMMLCVLTGERPDYKPDSVAGGHMVAWNVQAFAKAWLKWGCEHGYKME